MKEAINGRGGLNTALLIKPQPGLTCPHSVLLQDSLLLMESQRSVLWMFVDTLLS